jgi:hypothetical protein
MMKDRRSQLLTAACNAQRRTFTNTPLLVPLHSLHCMVCAQTMLWITPAAVHCNTTGNYYLRYGGCLIHFTGCKSVPQLL